MVRVSCYLVRTVLFEREKETYIKTAQNTRKIFFLNQSLTYLCVMLILESVTRSTALDYDCTSTLLTQAESH